MDIAVFTDTYLPTVNGVSYTISEWKDTWEQENREMYVVYPDGGVDIDSGVSTRSMTFPFYKDCKMGLPKFNIGIDEYDLVHAHTPFTIGGSGLLLSKYSDTPLVVSYHTPIHEYIDYLPVGQRVAEKIAKKFQNLFFSTADAVVVPTNHVKRKVERRTDTHVHAISNGVDTEFFKPKTTTEIDVRQQLEPNRPVVGYTGRHGHEKNIELIFEELGSEDVNILIGGDGPARDKLEKLARDCDANTVFTGFVDHDKLPDLYNQMDVFAFPSPVETQGKVALESIACGTPVVGLDKGALSETINHGVTGELSTEEKFGDSVLSVLENRRQFSDSCIEIRDELSIQNSVEDLEALYESLL